MTETFTDDGRDWVAQTLLEEELLIGVGTGTSTPSSTDDSLQSEIDRWHQSASIVSTTATGATGQFRVMIDITGGTEVESDTEITEFGLYVRRDDGTDELFYRSVRDPVEVASGETITFEIGTTFSV